MSGDTRGELEALLDAEERQWFADQEELDDHAMAEINVDLRQTWSRECGQQLDDLADELAADSTDECSIDSGEWGL